MGIISIEDMQRDFDRGVLPVYVQVGHERGAYGTYKTSVAEESHDLDENDWLKIACALGMRTREAARGLR